MNDFSSKCQILGDLWLDYKEDEAFADFIGYNDLGLPLAYVVSAGLAKVEPQGELYVNETWDLFVEALGLNSETEWESLEDMLENAVETKEE